MNMRDWYMPAPSMRSLAMNKCSRIRPQIHSEQLSDMLWGWLCRHLADDALLVTLRIESDVHGLAYNFFIPVA